MGIEVKVSIRMRSSGRGVLIAFTRSLTVEPLSLADDDGNRNLRPFGEALTNKWRENGEGEVAERRDT